MPHNLNKIKSCNPYKCPMSIVRKSFQPHNDKPKVSATQNINKDYDNSSNDGEFFTLTVVKTKCRPICKCRKK